MQAAKTADKTSEPLDDSANPENIDLGGASAVMSWDFSQDADIAKWPLRNNLQVERREGKTYLVATGTDPQIATTLDEPVSGTLVLELKASPTKGTSAQFFWAAAGGGFNATDTTARSLNATRQLAAVPISDRVGAADPDTAVRSVRERRRVADRVDHVVSLTTLVIGSSQPLSSAYLRVVNSTTLTCASRAAAGIWIVKPASELVVVSTCWFSMSRALAREPDGCGTINLPSVGQSNTCR